MRGRIDALELESRLLERNPLGDPPLRKCFVYLPPGYDEDDRRYPVVMVLPAFGSNAHRFVAYDIWKPNLTQLFDAMVVSGRCPPALLVLPDAITRWGGSQFLDSTATGPYQSFLAEEVVAEIDRRYRTIAAREARAVVGRSSGGFGALRLGMDRPDVFSVVGSHAGDAAFEVSLRPMFTAAAVAYDRAGGVTAFCERITEGGPASGADYDPLFFVAAAAAYAPEPSAPAPHAALPFEPRTGNPIPEVWERWLAQDPVARIDASADALRSLRRVFLDAGDADEYGLQLAARQLAEGMRRVGATVEHQEFEGGHRGTSWRYEVSLPLLIDALER